MLHCAIRLCDSRDTDVGLPFMLATAWKLWRRDDGTDAMVTCKNNQVQSHYLKRCAKYDTFVDKEQPAERLIA